MCWECSIQQRKADRCLKLALRSCATNVLLRKRLSRVDEAQSVIYKDMVTYRLDQDYTICNPTDISELLNSGVYLLYHDDKVVYVGCSNNILSRLGAHARTKVFNKIRYVNIEKEYDRLQIESILIFNLKPKYNKQWR